MCDSFDSGDFAGWRDGIGAQSFQRCCASPADACPAARPGRGAPVAARGRRSPLVPVPGHPSRGLDATGVSRAFVRCRRGLGAFLFCVGRFRASCEEFIKGVKRWIDFGVVEIFDTHGCTFQD